jgi:hypothetical protein
MAKLRAIIVADIEVSDLETALEFENILKGYAEKIKNHADPDASVFRGDNLMIEKVQAMIPMQERRGSTGDLDKIVFRGHLKKQ